MAVVMARLSNRACIQAAPLPEQEAEHRVTAQLLHVIAIAQGYAIGGEGLGLATNGQPPLAAIRLPQLEVTTAQCHESVKECPPFIAAKAGVFVWVDFREARQLGAGLAQLFFELVASVAFSAQRFSTVGGGRSAIGQQGQG